MGGFCSNILWFVSVVHQSCERWDQSNTLVYQYAAMHFESLNRHLWLVKKNTCLTNKKTSLTNKKRPTLPFFLLGSPSFQGWDGVGTRWLRTWVGRSKRTLGMVWHSRGVSDTRDKDSRESRNFFFLGKAVFGNEWREGATKKFFFF